MPEKYYHRRARCQCRSAGACSRYKSGAVQVKPEDWNAYKIGGALKAGMQ